VLHLLCIFDCHLVGVFSEVLSCFETVGTCILHSFLMLFPWLIPLIPLLLHLFPVSIIIISVIYYDISCCSYSYSSTRIFHTHLVYMLLFTPVFLYTTQFHTSLTCVWLSCLRTSLHYFLLQLVSSTTLFSCSLLYLVTGISLLVRRITMLSPTHMHCLLECLLARLLHTPLVQRYPTNTDLHIYVSIHAVFTPTYPTTIGYEPGALAFPIL